MGGQYLLYKPVLCCLQSPIQSSLLKLEGVDLNKIAIECFICKLHYCDIRVRKFTETILNNFKQYNYPNMCASFAVIILICQNNNYAYIDCEFIFM